MLKRLYIDNFLCLVNFELTLDETNVLLGPNGSGKTSVLRALHRIQGLVARGTRLEEMFPTDHLSLTQDRNEQRFELDVELDGNSYRYVLGVEHDRDRRCMQISEERLVHNDRMLFEFKDGNAQLYNDDYTEGPAYPFDSSRSGVGAMNARSDNRKLTRFKQELAKFIIASPCPPLFKSESRTEDGFLHPMIENFVGWYRHAAQENMGSITELFATLRDALPGFGSINLTEAGENSRALKVDFFAPGDGRRTVRYGLRQLSDGQRALLALYCLVFLSPNGRSSLFLDEPDNYLALREIQPWLVAVAEQCGGTLEQAVIVSHHPVTIDYMAGASGRWFYRDGIGPVRVSDKPDRTIDGLSLSETIARGWEA